jgi:hypothetical protein
MHLDVNHVDMYACENTASEHWYGCDNAASKYWYCQLSVFMVNRLYLIYDKCYRYPVKGESSAYVYVDIVKEKQWS